MSHPDHADAPPVRRSSFVRDLGVTVVVFVALVGAVAGWLWIRDAVDERGDRVETAAGVAATTPTTVATPVPTPEPSEPSTGATSTPTATAGSTPAPPPRWVPVVEVFAPGTDRAVAEKRAMAVTALGFPVAAMASDQVDGFEAGTWVLAGSERDSLDEALASCEGRALLRTCQANTLSD